MKIVRRRANGTSVPRVFISYARYDMRETNWLERLKKYLVPIQRKKLIDPWDDSRIGSGNRLRETIDDAIANSSAAIVLLGPGFFASDFIVDREVPALLEAEKKRGLRLYPVVVDWIDWERTPFEPFLAVNSPSEPLSSLSYSAQNNVLNRLCSDLQDDLQANQIAARPAKSTAPSDLPAVLREIMSHLEKTRVTFIAQAKRRDVLVDAVKKRLKLREKLEYEVFFLKYHAKMNGTEKAHFDQIRAMTEGTLFPENQRILQAIEENPEISGVVPRLSELRQHLAFWCNKYEQFFLQRPGMCVLYTGVEDGVPFPDGIEDEITEAIAKADRRSSQATSRSSAKPRRIARE